MAKVIHWPAVRITTARPVYTTTRTVRIGGTDVCYCDCPYRAKLIARALRGWMRTMDGQRWLADIDWESYTVEV
jgi:hypothetical protein